MRFRGKGRGLRRDEVSRRGPVSRSVPFRTNKIISWIWITRCEKPVRKGRGFITIIRHLRFYRLSHLVPTVKQILTSRILLLASLNYSTAMSTLLPTQSGLKNRFKLRGYFFKFILPLQRHTGSFWPGSIFCGIRNELLIRANFDFGSNPPSISVHSILRVQSIWTIFFNSSRINNRGPPRLSDLPPLPPDFDTPGMNPPPPPPPDRPYPFEKPPAPERPSINQLPPERPIRPFINGGSINEALVPQGNRPWNRPYRPGKSEVIFHGEKKKIGRGAVLVVLGHDSFFCNKSFLLRWYEASNTSIQANAAAGHKFLWQRIESIGEAVSPEFPKTN